ncbi:MAG: hypothetical protein ACI97A_000032 [Planctomycetota bacterium]|jgi:hypothetical protein
MPPIGVNPETEHSPVTWVVLSIPGQIGVNHERRAVRDSRRPTRFGRLSLNLGARRAKKEIASKACTSTLSHEP